MTYGKAYGASESVSSTLPFIRTIVDPYSCYFQALFAFVHKNGLLSQLFWTFERLCLFLYNVACMLKPSFCHLCRDDAYRIKQGKYWVLSYTNNCPTTLKI